MRASGREALGEPREPLRLSGVAGRPCERGGGGRGIRCVDQDAARGVGRIGGVGRVAAPPQVDAQAEVVDDPPGEQAHEVRVARQPRVDARPRTLRHGGAADVVEALEHDDRQTGAGEVRGGDEGVVPSADDHDVVGVRRASLHANALARSNDTGGGCGDDSVETWPCRNISKRSPSRSRARPVSSPGDGAREGVAIAATKSAVADIVTEADREVEALIRARLAAERPGDGFLGEESERRARGTTGITWVVDPIDGTVNYAYGIPAYAVSIAAVRGEPTRTVGGARRRRLQPARPASCSTRRAAPAHGSTAADSRSTPSRRPRARCSPPGSATTRRRMPAISRGSRG